MFGGAELLGLIRKCIAETKKAVYTDPASADPANPELIEYPIDPNTGAPIIDLVAADKTGARHSPGARLMSWDEVGNLFVRRYDFTQNPSIQDPVANGTVITPDAAAVEFENTGTCDVDVILSHGIRHLEYVTEADTTSTDRIRVASQRRISTDGGQTFGAWTEGPNGTYAAHQFFGAVGLSSNTNLRLINDTPAMWDEEHTIPAGEHHVIESRLVLETAIGWDVGTETAINNPQPQVRIIGGPSA